MAPRALEIFDLPKLPSYRGKLIMLDNRWVLTRGNPLHALSFFSYLNPKRRVYTAISEDRAGTALGGVIQHPDERFARLTYLAPEKPDLSPLALVEHLVSYAGGWQLRQVVTEVEENHPLFLTLRQSGFSVYTRQRIWDLSAIDRVAKQTPDWKKLKETDMLSIQTLQAEVVPPLLLPIEFFSDSQTGMICQSDETLAYVDCTYGLQGIFLRPLIHPNADDMRGKLLGLLKALPNRRGLPVYLCVRSYQAWIEPVLERLGAKASENQAVMVKHLVSMQKESKAVPTKGNRAWAKPAASIQHSAEHGSKVIMPN